MTTISQPNIPINIYRFCFKTDSLPRLPDFPGSAWRGAFGHALKKTVCVVRNQACNQCLLKNACAYSIVFETPPPTNTEKMRKYTAAPHPFVLQFPVIAGQASTSYSLDVILFGHGQRYFPYIVHAFKQAGQHGIGGRQQVFNLVQVDEINQRGEAETIFDNGELNPLKPPEKIVIPVMPQHIKINFNTQLRLKQDNKNLGAPGFNFGTFFTILLRRISMISYFYTESPLETDFAALTAKARTVQFSSQQLDWYDWTRYSSRQQTEIIMGGVMGFVELSMQDLEDFWPYLWLGQWTHLGKGTSMGMGAYQIEMTSLSTTQD